MHGMQEVSGSIPLSSTKFCTQQIWFVKRSCGAIAQLGERLHGMQEVSGSIPLSSTKIQNPRLGGGFCFSCFHVKHFLVKSVNLQLLKSKVISDFFLIIHLACPK
nr:hypothetical protein KV8917_160025 [Klebsiella variicola]